MATLYVRNVPEDLYERLRKRAEARDSSVSAETVRLLRRALRVDSAAVRAFLDDVEAHPLRVPPEAPPPSELIRQDRDAG